MKQCRRQLEFAIEVFVRGHSAVKSRTHPYEVDRVGPVWVMRDAPRKNERDYRKEEWVASGVEPVELSRNGGLFCARPRVRPDARRRRCD